MVRRWIQLRELRTGRRSDGFSSGDGTKIANDERTEARTSVDGQAGSSREGRVNGLLRADEGRDGFDSLGVGSGQTRVGGGVGRQQGADGLFGILRVGELDGYGSGTTLGSGENDGGRTGGGSGER